MKTTMIVVLALSLGLSFGCSSGNAAQQTSVDAVQDTIDTYSLGNIDFSMANDLCQKHKENLVLTKAERSCADKVNELAFLMLHQMNKDQTDSSFVVSPMSLNCAIAMAGNGAAGRTLQEIERLVGPIAVANSFFKKYHAALPHNEYSNCGIFNYLAVNPKDPIKKDFTDKISTIYDACVKPIDFANPKSVKQINDWFCQLLQDESLNVVKELDAETSLLLANVLDFRAFWSLPFNSQFTYDHDFTTDNGEILQIPMMYCQERTCLYTENASFKAVSLSYLGSCYRMLLVLPKTEKLSKLTSAMTSNTFSNILNSLKEKEVELSLPRFRCVGDMEVKEMLSKVIPSAFDVQKANFRAICELPTWINEISHKTSIEVTEQGTKARSITVESFLVKAETENPKFIANRPFMYIVYDDATHAIILTGQFCGDGAISNRDNN
jgi:serpin B